MYRHTKRGMLMLAAFPLLAQAGTFTGWQTNGNAALLDDDGVLRLTGTTQFEVGSAWAPQPLSLLGNFSLAFSFRIDGGSGADGLTLTFQHDQDGAGALGVAGGDLGYQGIGPSVAFIYDTFDNDFDTDRKAGHNTAVAMDGDLESGWGGLDVSHPVEFASGLRESVLFSWIDYDVASGQFAMYLNDIDVKPGSPVENIGSDWPSRLGNEVLVGFTAATGALTDNHDILSFSVNVAPVPLPPAAWLLASGLAGLGALRRRR